MERFINVTGRSYSNSNNSDMVTSSPSHNSLRKKYVGFILPVSNLLIDGRSLSMRCASWDCERFLDNLISLILLPKRFNSSDFITLKSLIFERKY